MEKMVRKASDNKYFHRDFHVGLNLGIEYIAEIYGDDAVIEYLEEYTRVYHKPLIEAIKKQGLAAIEDYFTRLYEIEEAPEVISFSRNENELIIEISECPVIKYIKSQGKGISHLFIETTNTVNKTLVEGTPYAFEMISFDNETGKSRHRFYKKED
jgi:hypothetical protein